MIRWQPLALAALLATASTAGTVLLSTYAGPVAAQSSRSATAMPRISAFDVKAVDKIEPGAELAFTLWGTPGALASLRIDGANRELRLVETSAGVYTGIYTISRRDQVAPDARVTGVLRRGNQVGSALLDEPLQVGWAPAVAVSTPQIDRFTVQHGGDRSVGSRIQITLLGTPGGRASVRLPGAQRRAVLLDEVRPGEYSGSYTVTRADQLRPDQPAVARLRLGDLSVTSELDKALDGSRVTERRDARTPALCADCGRVEAINRVEVDGDGNHVGTVAGGLLGAVIGSQFGKGDGRTAAGVAGAVGGALIGREIEKKSRRSVHHEVVLRMADGQRKVVVVEQPPTWQVGDSVRVVDGVLQAWRG